MRLFRPSNSILTVHMYLFESKLSKEEYIVLYLSNSDIYAKPIKIWKYVNLKGDYEIFLYTIFIIFTNANIIFFINL